MSAFRFHCSRPTYWIAPRAPLDAHRRYHAYGPVQPMDEDRPGLWERLFRFR